MKRSHFLLILCLALGMIFVLGTVAALAAGDTKQVGLVIAFPDGSRYSDVLTVPVTATTFDLLHAAKIDLVGANGQFGPTVCSINKTGCPSGNCFCDPKHFWAFYELDKATNKWVASQQGVAAVVPANAAVEGFVWSEMDANYNPTNQPPVVTFAQLQAAAGQPASTAAPASTPGPAATAAVAPAPARLPTTGTSPALWVVVLSVALLGTGLWLKYIARSSSSGGKA